jgi:penicillin-binding protein 1A
MVKAGKLSQADFEKYKAEPVKLKFHVSDHKDGMATYFRDFLRRYLTAKKPERALYASWNMVRFYVDSITWESDPLYGW